MRWLPNCSLQVKALLLCHPNYHHIHMCTVYTLLHALTPYLPLLKPWNQAPSNLPLKPWKRAP